MSKEKDQLWRVEIAPLVVHGVVIQVFIRLADYIGDGTFNLVLIG